MKSYPIIPPVYLTATYKFDKTDDLIEVVQNRSGFIYSRWDNPTVQESEKVMARLEGFDSALAFSSGMAAISTSLLCFLHRDSRIIYQREIYGGTFELLSELLPRLGVETVAINCENKNLFFEEIKKGVSILYLESPTNPLLRVVDIEPLAAAAHQQGAIVMLDSTFASPVNQQPKNFGVDIVLHSATKYIGGHHDLTAGFACCSKKIADRLWTYRKSLGGVMDPLTAFLVLRGMQTLELRVLRQNENAKLIAQYLENQAKISVVHYPGLVTHPDFEIAKRQMQGFGGMLSFEVDADFETTKKFMDHLKTIKLATSLGGVTSLANQPITNTHAALNVDARAKAGISENLVRLSVGIEDANLLIQDLQQALDII